jgi:hypothetical protein
VVTISPTSAAAVLKPAPGTVAPNPTGSPEASPREQRERARHAARELRGDVAQGVPPSNRALEPECQRHDQVDVGAADFSEHGNRDQRPDAAEAEAGQRAPQCR